MPSAERSAREVRHDEIAAFVRTVLALAPWRAARVFAWMLARTVTSGVGLLLLVPMLGVVGLEVDDGSIGALSSLVARAFAWVGMAPSLPAVLAVYVAVMTTTALLARWQAVAARAFEQDVVTRVRKDLYDAVARARWAYFAMLRSTDLTHLLTTEVERVGAAVSALLSLAVTVALAVAYVGFALVLSPAMTTVAAGAGIGLSLVLRRTTLRGHARGAAISDAYAHLYAATGEHMSGMKVSKSLGIEAEQGAIFHRRSDGASDARVDLERNSASLALGFEIGSVAILAGMLWLALEVLTLPLATVLLLLFLFARLIPYVTGVQKAYQRFLNVLPAHGRVASATAAGRAAAESDRPRARPYVLERALTLDAVEYAYDGDGTRVLRGIDLVLRAGETTALVGPSGAGKSTLADLVIGLAVPTRGSVRIDGEILTSDRLLAWRRQVGYVPQDVFLFHDTIRANLRMVAPDADEAQLWRALEDAAAQDFVSSLAEGLDTVVGDRGVRLSGGERQRLALARALLRRPRLLVLDEATSALDVENEQRIQAAIDGLRGKVTILVIAHRLSTVRRTDAIYVLEDGAIVESGAWGTLASKPAGRFRELCRAQGLLDDGEAIPLNLH